MSARGRGRDRRDLRLTEARVAGRRRRSIQQLVLMIGALILLLAFWSQLSQGAAGCFAQLAPPAPDAASGAADAGATPAAPGEQGLPAVRIQMPDAAAK